MTTIVKHHLLLGLVIGSIITGAIMAFDGAPAGAGGPGRGDSFSGGELLFLDARRGLVQAVIYDAFVNRREFGGHVVNKKLLARLLDSGECIATWRHPRTNHSVLFLAVQAKSFDLVRKALERGSDANEVNPTGAGYYDVVARDDEDADISQRDILSHAVDISLGGWVFDYPLDKETIKWGKVAKRESDIVALLIEHGADVNIADGRLLTTVVCDGGSEEIFTTLLKAKAMLRKEKTDHLHYAARRKSTLMIQGLLNFGLSVNQLGYKGATPLHFMLRNRDRQNGPHGIQAQTDTIIALLKAGADVTIADAKGRTPITKARENKYSPNLVALLSGRVPLSVGSNGGRGAAEDEGVVAVIDRPDDYDGNTPLYTAIDSQNVHQLKDCLARSANPNAQNWNGDVPLPFAAQQNNVEMVQELLKYGANVNHLNEIHYTVGHRRSVNVEAWSALHWAVKHKNLCMMQALLGIDGVNLDIASKKGLTPLMVSVCGGFFDGAKLLLLNGAIPDSKSIACAIHREFFYVADLMREWCTILESAPDLSPHEVARRLGWKEDDIERCTVIRRDHGVVLEEATEAASH